MLYLSYQHSKKPEDDLLNPEVWVKTTDVKTVSFFSAICLLYAKYLTQKLGPNKVILFGVV